MKVTPKKRELRLKRNSTPRIPESSRTKSRILWYSASITLYAWYMYWIAYEIFVWHKPITEVNVANYAGAIAAISFIWAGTKLWKKTNESPKPNQQKPQPKKTQPFKQQQPSESTSKPTCPHHYGYLHERRKTKEIPTECLTCQKVIECFRPKK